MFCRFLNKSLEHYNLLFIFLFNNMFIITINSIFINSIIILDENFILRRTNCCDMYTGIKVQLFHFHHLFSVIKFNYAFKFNDGK